MNVIRNKQKLLGEKKKTAKEAQFYLQILRKGSEFPQLNK